MYNTVRRVFIAFFKNPLGKLTYNSYTVYMKTSKILFFLLAACAAVPASAQKWKAGEGALQAIRTAQTAVRLNVTALPGNLSATRAAAQSAAFRSQYTQALQAVKDAARSAAAPVELTYKAKRPVEIGGQGIGPVARRKMAVTAKQRHDWGKTLADNQALGLKNAPRVARENDAPVLIHNKNKAFIRSQKADAGETVITPVEIGVNAATLKSATEGLTPDMLTAVFNQTPEHAAGFFYLHEQFTQSLAKFEASADALHTLAATTSLKERMFGPSEQTVLIRQNYGNAAANLAEDAINLLKFMELHPDVFSASLKSYREIMRLHNVNSHTPATFQTFWKNPVSI